MIPVWHLVQFQCSSCPDLHQSEINKFFYFQPCRNSLASATIIDQCQPNLRQAIHQSGRGASYTRETQSVSILSSLTLAEVPLSEEREREKTGVHFAKVYSLRKGCSFSPESLYHLSLLFLNINYLSCHLITEPKRYLVYPSYLHRPFPLSRCLFCKYCSEKGSRVPSLGSFCAISG